jgi:type III secretion protein L
VFIIRHYADLSRPDAAEKIIKAKDFWAFKEAERAIVEALNKQQQIISAAQEAYVAEEKRGYEAGTEKAKLEQSGNMAEIVTHTVEYFSKVESQMVDLVLDAVRKVVSDFDDRQRVATVVKNCLDLVRSQKQLALSVHPSQVAYLRSQVAELQKLYPSISHIDVQPDARLAVDACVVESEIGTVEASLAGQVETLRDALSVVFEQSNPLRGQPQEDDDSPKASEEADDKGET